MPKSQRQYLINNPESFELTSQWIFLRYLKKTMESFFTMEIIWVCCNCYCLVCLIYRWIWIAIIVQFPIFTHSLTRTNWFSFTTMFLFATTELLIYMTTSNRRLNTKILIAHTINLSESYVKPRTHNSILCM